MSLGEASAATSLVDERDDRAAEAAAGHTCSIARRTRTPQLDEAVELGDRHLEVVRAGFRALHGTARRRVGGRPRAERRRPPHAGVLGLEVADARRHALVELALACRVPGVLERSRETPESAIDEPTPAGRGTSSCSSDAKSNSTACPARPKRHAASSRIPLGTPTRDAPRVGPRARARAARRRSRRRRRARSRRRSPERPTTTARRRSATSSVSSPRSPTGGRPRSASSATPRTYRPNRSRRRSVSRERDGSRRRRAQLDRAPGSHATSVIPRSSATGAQRHRRDR